MSDEVQKLREVLTRLLSYAERQICTHEETHRGGAIWEICDICGDMWADDKGGKPEFKWPAEIEAARAILADVVSVVQSAGMPELTLQVRIADLLHLLQFAKIETPTPGDAPQAERIMNDLQAMLATPAQTVPQDQGEVQRLREALNRIRDHAARIMDDEVFYEADSALSASTGREVKP